jgi:hypothetical protein
MDALPWDRNWTMSPLGVFRERVARAAAADASEFDGGCTEARDPVWPRAGTVVWLEYALRLALARLAVQDAYPQHGRNSRLVPAQLADPAHAHLRPVRFSRPRVAARWPGAVSPAAPERR